MIKNILLLLTLTFISSTAIAQMYKWVDEEGNISYSDQPPYKGAKQLDAPALTSMPAVNVPKAKPKAKTETPTSKDQPTRYSLISITSPKHDETIRDNNGNFSISFNSKPALDTKAGHYFSLKMDGKTVQDKFSSPSSSLTNIDRGTHNLTVLIKSKKGKTLISSKATTVYLHRKTVIKKTPRAAPPRAN